MSDSPQLPMLGSDLHHRDATGKVRPAKVVAVHDDGSLDLVVFGHAFPFAGLVVDAPERMLVDATGWCWPGAVLPVAPAMPAVDEQPPSELSTTATIEQPGSSEPTTTSTEPETGLGQGTEHEKQPAA